MEINSEIMLLYRIEGSAHYYDGYASPDISLHVQSFTTFKKTEKGYWINVYGKMKWVSSSGKKRYAYPTVAEAKINFIKRRTKYVEILKRKLQEQQAILLEIGRDSCELKEYNHSLNDW